jgi:hypothetical protein
LSEAASLPRNWCCVTPKVQEIIAARWQRFANEVAADLTLPAVARVTVEKTTPEGTSTLEIAVAVEVARKVAKRSPRSPSIKRAIDAAIKVGARIVIAPDKSVTITGAPATDNPENEVAVNGVELWEQRMSPKQ